MPRTQLEWTNIEIAECSKAIKDKYAAIEKARKDFEDTFTLAARKGQHIQPNQSLKFSYRFGSPGFAVVEGTAGKSKNTFSL